MNKVQRDRKRHLAREHQRQCRERNRRKVAASQVVGGPPRNYVRLDTGAGPALYDAESAWSGTTAAITIPIGVLSVDEPHLTLREKITHRGRCPECGKREKITKAGVMAKHGDCVGVGMTPDE